MKNEISDYKSHVRKTLAEGKATPEFVEMLEKRIEFYQHERLVHLIVTMTFAVMTVLSFFMLTLEVSPMSVGLSLLFLCLTIPYIGHYYFLENSVQKLYEYYYEAKASLSDER